jgi:hypothetical protein
MATIMGTGGRTINIDPPTRESYLEYLKHKDEPPTKEELEFWQKSDDRLIAVYQKKLEELGLEHDYQTAKSVWQSPADKEFIDYRYAELQARVELGGAVERLEKLRQKSSGKES